MSSPQEVASELWGGKPCDWEIVTSNNNVVCSDCDGHASVQLCSKCMQKALTNSYKTGALEELGRIRSQLDVLPNRHFKEYLRSVIIKRIKELEGKE